jgi:thymidylate kinase
MVRETRAPPAEEDLDTKKPDFSCFLKMEPAEGLERSPDFKRPKTAFSSVF